VLFGIIPLVTSEGVTPKEIPLFITEDIAAIIGVVYSETTTEKAVPFPQKEVEGITW
jgi:hypothetical protein